MRFLRFQTDGRKITRANAESIASTVFPVTDIGWHYADDGAQLELIQPRLWGWLSWILPDRREWVTPISSDDAYPLRFERPHYRLERTWKQVQHDEASAHQNTRDVAMTAIQKNSSASFWTLPLSLMVILVSIAFLAMILTWIYLGAFAE